MIKITVLQQDFTKEKTIVHNQRRIIQNCLKCTGRSRFYGYPVQSGSGKIILDTDPDPTQPKSS
jgi:hypothetical protein